MTLCDRPQWGIKPGETLNSGFGGLQRAGVLPVARCAREGTVPHVTHSSQGEMVSKRALNRRNRHVALINAETMPWRRYWRAACFLVSELHALYRRDPRRARDLGDDLARQTRDFALRLNAEEMGEAGHDVHV